jgi:hypothetical protein
LTGCVFGGFTGQVGGVSGMVGGVVGDGGHGQGVPHDGGVGGCGWGGMMQAKAVPAGSRTSAAAVTSGNTTRRVDGQGRGRVEEVATGEAPSRGAGMFWDIEEDPFHGCAT